MCHPVSSSVFLAVLRMSRRPKSRMTKYADPADPNSTTELRQAFLHAIQIHAADEFLKRLREDVWATYRASDAHCDWSVLRNAGPMSHPELVPLRACMTGWAEQLHLIDARGGPSEWLMNVSLGMMQRWKTSPALGGRFLLPSSRIPGIPKLVEELQKIQFEFRDRYDGMPLDFYVATFRQRLDQAADEYSAQLHAICQRFGVPLRDKTSLATHLEWLIQNLIFGRTARQILKEYPAGHPLGQLHPYSVNEAIRGVAAQLGLQVRRDKGGRPPTLTKSRI